MPSTDAWRRWWEWWATLSRRVWMARTGPPFTTRMRRRPRPPWSWWCERGRSRARWPPRWSARCMASTQPSRWRMFGPWRPCFNAALLGIFAQIAFVLAAVGIYGVISYDVSQRTHEIGIRAALGAQPTAVLKLILGQGARVAAGGIALGMAAAFAPTRLMANLLYQVKP